MVASLASQLPEERPKTVAVRRHVLWWKPQEQLVFLCNLSQFLKGKRHLSESLNERAAELLPGEAWPGGNFLPAQLLAAALLSVSCLSRKEMMR